MSVNGALTLIHQHENGRAVLAAAGDRARNTTIVIGVDQHDGTLLIDIDVQEDVCSGAKELREQLLLIVEALDGHDPLASSPSTGGSDV
jgi:hypothetical protein